MLLKGKWLMGNGQVAEVLNMLNITGVHYSGVYIAMPGIYPYIATYIIILLTIKTCGSLDFFIKNFSVYLCFI